ncbi:MAG: DUF2169 domain-containing protein [Polyangiaceae bacterium]
MMELISRTPLQAAQQVWRPGHGGFVLTVVCKATFSLRPGVSPLAQAQQPITMVDVYSEGSRGPQWASEVVPLKKQPEVLVAGHVHAPGGRKAASVMARLAVGEIEKSVQVTGDRWFGLDGQLSEPAPFAKMPIVWERSAGGADTSNPVGRAVGSGGVADMYGRVAAPNFLPPELQLTSRSDIVATVGLGPIAPHWPSRAGCLNRHAAGWSPAAWHERPLPADIDLAYFNAAPPDQRRALPFGEELLSLENLHPLFAQLSTRLAPVSPSVVVERGQGSEAMQLRCDTLLIDSDRGLAMLVWRGHVVLERPDQPGRIVIADRDAPAVPVAAKAQPVFDATQAVSSGVAGPALPFAAGVPGAVSAVVAGPAEGPPGAAAGSGALVSGATVAVDALFGGTMAFGFANAAPAVPFPSAPADGPEQRDPASNAGTGGLPFAPVTPVPPPPDTAAPPVTGTVAPVTGLVASLATGMVAPPVTGMVAPLATGMVAPVETDLPPSPETDSPAPPPMLGAIALDRGGPEQVPGAGEAGAVAGSAGAAGAAKEAAGEDADFEAFSPSRCGALEARLACNEAKSAEILRAEEIDAERWERVHERWLERIEAETARGRPGLRREYDGAYVKALEGERGEITVAIYAKLAIANERCTLDETLEELRFPEDAWLHIVRAWIPKQIEDPELAARVLSATNEARAAG